MFKRVTFARGRIRLAPHLVHAVRAHTHGGGGGGSPEGKPPILVKIAPDLQPQV